MNFDTIKYIFQIPIEWYKKIHNRVFNAYGTNFLIVREGFYGGTEIGIDDDLFAEQVKRNVELSGYVKSVDDVVPDENGNVELCAVCLTGDQTIYGTKTFASNVYLSSQPGLPEANSLALATIGHVNTFYARKSHDHGNLNNDGTITNIGSGITKNYYIAADDNGDLYKSDLSNALYGVVKSVNDTTPDENGNVTITVGGGGVSSVNNIAPDANGNVNLGSIVNTVENISPDQYGNVELTSMVKSVNNVFPVNGNVTLNISSVTMQDVEDYVTQQNFATESYVTQQGYATTSYVDDSLDDFELEIETKLLDYAQYSDLSGYATQTQLCSYVKEVDGHTPTNGEIDFNLDSNKWMKTDANGHIATTDENIIALSSTSNGYLYANNGSLQFLEEQYVDLSSSQTVSGEKTWEDTALFNGVINAKQAINITDTLHPNNYIIAQVESGYGQPLIMLNGSSSSGAAIGFSLGSPVDNCFLTKNLSGFNVGDYTQVTLRAPANKVVLDAQPTETSTNSLAVATVGYVQSQLSGYTTNTPVKMVTNVTWNGTQIVIASKNLSFKNGVLTAMTNNTNTTINTVAYTS